MLRGLTRKKVKFVVVGGVAAAAHGSSRVTNDLDICYDASDRANLVALASVLSSWDAYPRGIEPGLPFILDDRTLFGAPVLTLTTSEGDIDVMDRIAGVGDYTAVKLHSERISASAFDSACSTFLRSSRPSARLGVPGITIICRSSRRCSPYRAVGGNLSYFAEALPMNTCRVLSASRLMATGSPTR